MRKIIEEFLTKTPDWIEITELPAKVAWKDGSCFLCGTNRKKIKELYEAIAEDYGKVKIKIIK